MSEILGAFGYRFEVDGAEVAWWLVDAVLDEALNELPLAVFDVLAPAAVGPAAFGKTVRFELQRYAGPDQPLGDPLVRHGTVVRVDAMPRVADGRHRARVHVSHKAFALGLGRRCRILAKLKASEAIERVVQQVGLAGAVVATTHVHEALTQYHETDLDWIRRLAEDHGAVVRWSPISPTDFEVGPPGGKDSTSVGSFALVPPHEAPTADADSLLSFAQEFRVAVDKHRVTGWDPAKKALLDASEDVPGAKKALGLVVDHGAASVRGALHALLPVGDNAKAAVTVESSAAGSFRGTSNALALTAGRAFDVEDLTESSFDGTYRVARVQHRVSLTDQGEQGGKAIVYENEFECVAKAFPCRPPRVVQRPLALAPQIGIVTAIPHQSESALKACEVQVRFPQWGVEGDTAVWLRLLQPFAGSDHGFQFIPHINDEVLVQFVDGDPDKPVVVGSLYNGKDLPPAQLPNLHTRSVIRASPYHGSPTFGGVDEIYFEEEASHRVVGINVAEDHVIEVGNDVTLHAVRDRITNVDRDDKQTVKGVMTLDVTKDRTTGVKGNDKTTVDKNAEATIKGNAKTTVFQKLTLSADVGIVLQCGDTKIELSPAGIKLTNAAGATVDLTATVIKVDNGSGAKVELVGPMVNLN